MLIYNWLCHPSNLHLKLGPVHGRLMQYMYHQRHWQADQRLACMDLFYQQNYVHLQLWLNPNLQQNHELPLHLRASFFWLILSLLETAYCICTMQNCTQSREGLQRIGRIKVTASVTNASCGGTSAIDKSLVD